MNHYEIFCMLRDHRAPGADAPKYTEAEAFSRAQQQAHSAAAVPAAYTSERMLESMAISREFALQPQHHFGTMQATSGAHIGIELDVNIANIALYRTAQPPVTVNDLLDAERWRFMMASANDPNGPEAAAWELADEQISADDMALSEHMVAVTDAAILITKGTTP